MPRYEKMFRSLGAHLPAITIFVLGQGWWFFTILPIAIALVSTALLVRARSNVARIAAPFLANQAVIAVIGVAGLGIFYPILESQKPLSG